MGVNGAGKTSTFKMLTGDTSMSAGNAFLNSHRYVDRKTSMYETFNSFIVVLVREGSFNIFSDNVSLPSDLSLAVKYNRHSFEESHEINCQKDISMLYGRQLIGILNDGDGDDITCEIRGLMSKTMALHVNYNFLNISVLTSTQ